MTENPNAGTGNPGGSTVPATETASETIVVTLESLQAIADATFDEYSKIRRDATKTEAEKLAANQKNYAADKAVRDFVENAKKRELEQKMEIAKLAFRTIKDTWFDMRNNLANAQRDLAKVPVGKRTAEQNKSLDDLNAEFVKLDNELNAHLDVAFIAAERKRDHPIAMGVTGKQLEKQQNANATPSNGRTGSKSATIKSLLASKVNVALGQLTPESVIDEIVAETGYERKGVSDIKWAWEIEVGLRKRPAK